MNKEGLKSYGKTALRSATAILMLASTLAPQRADATGVVVEDNRAFPQCVDVNYLPKGDLSEEDYGVATLKANGVNVVDVQPLPSAVELRFSELPIRGYCVTSLAYEYSRFGIQTSEGSGYGFPDGGTSSTGERGKVTLTSPEGRNSLLVTTRGQWYPGSGEVTQQWIFSNLQPYETTSIGNSDGSYTTNILGPVAILLNRENPGSPNPSVSAEVVASKTEVASVPFTRINLTPPEGSVTPNAHGLIDVTLLSYNAQRDMAELLSSGKLEGLRPDTQYKLWFCWTSGGDCGTFNKPEIITNGQGMVDFEGLNVTIFNRPKLPVSSIKVIEETYGEVDTSVSCYTTTNPCLQAPFSVIR